MTIRLGTTGDGYTYIYEPGDRENRVYLHRLTAVAEHGIDAIRGMDVHHVDGVTWRDSVDNLIPSPPDYHRGAHLNGLPI